MSFLSTNPLVQPMHLTLKLNKQITRVPRYSTQLKELSTIIVKQHLTELTAPTLLIQGVLMKYDSSRDI